MSTVEARDDDELTRPHPLPRSASNPNPKGLLKSAAQGTHPAQHSLQWDEANRARTEIQKDSLMKITEPKTVEIPDFDLNGRFYPDSPTRSTRSISPTGADTSGLSLRCTSISSSGRPSASSSGQSASTASSRSTSFKRREQQ
ncbi:hypothetical protein BDZ89DRAFT_1130706 [Hymenopellis radicata]|nr:hypothetical protein BDZ89DRAFT_1133819 [Hymenopellis radicata]KAF9034496.1 hypothetical protein BDZ89DRAFT_1130706 [Hymenopellis radicata]